MMVAKKKKAEPQEEQAVEEQVVEEQPAPKPAAKKAASVWKCPHCATQYPADWIVAKKNHLARVHGLI